MALSTALTMTLLAPAVMAESGYDKGFFIRDDSGAFKLKIGARVQPRLSIDVPDEGDTGYHIKINRARLKLGGNVLTKDLTFKLQVDFSKGDVSLKDFFLDYRIVSGVQVRIGQYKRPFSRQQIASSSKLALVDRTITDKGFGAGRDIGVMVHNNYEKAPEFEWAFGVFNGASEKGTFRLSRDDTDAITGVSRSNVPDTMEPALVLRVAYNTDQMQGQAYDEADLTPDKGLRFAVGGGLVYDLGAGADEVSALAADVDFLLKVSGFSALGAFYTSLTDGELDAIGFHAQVGYVIDGTVQPAIRIARIMPDADDAADLQEIAGGVSVFFSGHRLKWQTDVGALMTEASGGDTTDVFARSQLEFSF